MMRHARGLECVRVRVHARVRECVRVCVHARVRECVRGRVHAVIVFVLMPVLVFMFVVVYML